MKLAGRMIILKTDRSLFGQVCKERKKPQDERYPNSSPWSSTLALSTSDRLLRKTSKASLDTYLKKGKTVAEEYLVNCASIIDGVNLIQRVKGDQATLETLPLLFC